MDWDTSRGPADGGLQSDGIAYQTIHVYVITHIILVIVL